MQSFAAARFMRKLLVAGWLEVCRLFPVRKLKQRSESGGGRRSAEAFSDVF